MFPAGPLCHSINIPAQLLGLTQQEEAPHTRAHSSEAAPWDPQVLISQIAVVRTMQSSTGFW